MATVSTNMTVLHDLLQECSKSEWSLLDCRRKVAEEQMTRAQKVVCIHIIIIIHPLENTIIRLSSVFLPGIISAKAYPAVLKTVSITLPRALTCLLHCTPIES